LEERNLLEKMLTGDEIWFS